MTDTKLDFILLAIFFLILLCLCFSSGFFGMLAYDSFSTSGQEEISNLLLKENADLKTQLENLR